MPQGVCVEICVLGLVLGCVMVETSITARRVFYRAGCGCAKPEKRRGARRMHMNDDTVPDGGKSIGLDSGRMSLDGLKVLSFGLALAISLCAQALTYEVDGILWSYKKFKEQH